MPKRLTTEVVVALVAVVVLTLVVAGTIWWRSGSGTDFQRAAKLAPPDSERLSWTDWRAVRAELEADLSTDSSANDVRAFLGDGFDADLTSTSALVESAPVMQIRYGFSPATIEWELFSQSARGAVVIMRLADDTDFLAIEDRLDDLGYLRPDDDTGTWRGGDDLMGTIGPNLTPELQYVALDADRQLVLSSDNAAYLDRAVQDSQDGDGLQADLGSVVDASADAITASAFDGTYTCTALAMSQADEDDQAQADLLIDQAGKVSPIRSMAMSVQPDRSVLVTMAFANDDQAKVNADTRAVLLAGPAPGQGGDFTDRFQVDAVTADGPLVIMALDPNPDSYVLSDLSSGPVLFATC